MKACILVAVGSDPQRVAENTAHLPGVVDAFPVKRRKEVVIRADVRGLAHLTELLERLSAVEGVILSETLLEIPQAVTR
jgi:class 3 adenylate cyclase